MLMICKKMDLERAKHLSVTLHTSRAKDSVVVWLYYWLLWPLKRLIRYCWRSQWGPTPGLLPRKSHGWRSLVGCSPWGLEESDKTEWLHFHFLLSCIGEGNGNPLQCSCLENPRDEGAWWAAVYGVAQSRTRLRRLSSSSFRNWGQIFGRRLQNILRDRTWTLSHP